MMRLSILFVALILALSLVGCRSATGTKCATYDYDEKTCEWANMGDGSYNFPASYR
jgi:outer membrane lipoprotein SlyB